MPDPGPEWQERAAEIIAAHAGMEGAAIPILHALQTEFGFVPPEMIPAVANTLNISRAEMHGIVTFYHDFRSAPPPRHVLRLCRAEACQASGGEALARHALARVPEGWGGTMRDGVVAVEAVFCLGLC